MEPVSCILSPRLLEVLQNTGHTSPTSVKWGQLTTNAKNISEMLIVIDDKQHLETARKGRIFKGFNLNSHETAKLESDLKYNLY